MTELLREVTKFDDVRYFDSTGQQYVMFFPKMSNKYVEVSDGETIVVVDSSFAIAMSKQILEHYGDLTNNGVNT